MSLIFYLLLGYLMSFVQIKMVAGSLGYMNERTIRLLFETYMVSEFLQKSDKATPQ